MLQLTRKADYGLRLMLEVCGSPSGTTATAGPAQRRQIPYKFLRKVAQTLVSHGRSTSNAAPRSAATPSR